MFLPTYTYVIMKTTLLLLPIIEGILARPQSNPGPSFITRYDFKLKDPGGFKFIVETSDGFHHHANGKLKDVGTPNEGLVVTGTYSYIEPDGTVYIVKYIADSNGFQPSIERLPGGGNLPVPKIAGDCTASLCGTGFG